MPETIKLPKAKRTEGIYEQAYKDLLFYVRGNLCQSCFEGVVDEVKIIEQRMREKESTMREKEGK